MTVHFFLFKVDVTACSPQSVSTVYLYETGFLEKKKIRFCDSPILECRKTLERLNM